MVLDLRLLIIDDEVDLCFLLAKSLKKYLKEILYCHTLKDALANTKQLNPDWIILDNNLPDGKGWEHISEFKVMNPEVKIICISANPDSVVLENDSVYKYTKPLNVDSILNLIKTKTNS